MRRELVPETSPVNAPHQPDLQRIEPLRTGNRELSYIGEAPLRSKQVRRTFLERFRQPRPIAHQHSSSSQRHEHHLVRIKDQRVGLLNSFESSSKTAAEGESRSMSCVDMKPGTMLSSNL